MTRTDLTPAEIAVDFIEAFGRRDLTTLADLIADDVAFESPAVRLSGAKPVLEAIGQFAQAVTGVDIISVLGDDRQAMIMYDMATGPFGTLRAVDNILVEHGKITSDFLVFDTYEVRKGG